MFLGWNESVMKFWFVGGGKGIRRGGGLEECSMSWDL